MGAMSTGIPANTSSQSGVPRATRETASHSTACIEVEDRAFEDSRQKILDSLVLSKRYMEQFVI